MPRVFQSRNARVTVDFDDVREYFFRLGSERNRRRFLIRAGNLVAVNARRQMITGVVGGSPPVPRRLTSRTGRGRSSIVPSSPTREGIQVGTSLEYMALHENGGTVTVPAYRRSSPTGTLHTVRSHRRRYPPRPFLAPGIDVSMEPLADLLMDELLRG